MLTSALINQNIPRLQPADTVAKALQLINDFKLTHLPVVSEGIFLGLISEEDLLDVEEGKGPIEFLSATLIQAAVRDDVHFLQAIQVCIQHEANVIAVIDKNKLLKGVITSNLLLNAMGSFAGASERGGMILLKMEPSQFSASELCRIAESEGCAVLHLNAISNLQEGSLEVSLIVNKQDIGALVNSLERYEYQVLHYIGKEEVENEIRNNFRHLMNYLDI
jgi:acetoin utilization protein AcuB